MAVAGRDGTKAAAVADRHAAPSHEDRSGRYLLCADHVYRALLQPQRPSKIVQASARNLKRVSLELGGKSPDIVFADADLDAAVPGAAMAVFANTGQICSAGTRLFVERRIYDEFTGRVAEFSRSLKVGPGLDPETQVGPLVSSEQLDRVTGYFDIGTKEGARALSGGARLTEGALAQGYFVPPTVFADVTDEMRVAQEEIFGPVISAIPFDDVDVVIARGNATDFGLGSGVWTRDVSKAHRLAKGLRAGSVWINCYQTWTRRSRSAATR